MCIYIYIYMQREREMDRYNTHSRTSQPKHFRKLPARKRQACARACRVARWILCRGGCSGSGVQWIGVVLHSKLVYNVI